GILYPLSSELERIELYGDQPVTCIGRNPEDNDAVLLGLQVSNKHCKITLDGRGDGNFHVTVTDYSTNGTWINGSNIGKGQTRILKDGNEIAFGQSRAQRYPPATDYRYIYRRCASTPPTGLHAHYDVGHQLGQGSFGTVSKALSRKTGIWYAVKVIPRQRNQKFVSVIAQEIAAMEKLQHKNICQIEEVFFSEHSISLVLEYIDGGDLMGFIRKHNGLDEFTACNMTHQITTAMAHIHGRGIIHRDLKPENILLTSDNPPIVKIADFGLAKIVDIQTIVKTECGTPTFMAPEVMTRQSYSHLVDSWSVGIIVYGMMTTYLPFFEDPPMDIRIQVADRTIDLSALDNVKPSSAAKHFIESLLQYDPNRRLSLINAEKHPWLVKHNTILTIDPNLDTEARSIGPELVSTGERCHFLGVHVRPNVDSRLHRALFRGEQ
ncbi:kinase-like protein, partial [Coniophora puteana RWD-64-598 SS2]